MAFETLRTAWIGLMSHRLRTALTVLGITIGIASVIVLIAVGKGSSDAVQESIDALGSDTLTVTSGGGASFGGMASSSVTLEKADAEALEGSERAPAVKSASPVVSASGT
jgi:putative ABC transport system permease protein